MQESKESELLKDEVELDLNEQELEEVEISDLTMEAEDKKSGQAKKAARKTAKKLRSPEERKSLRKKQALIGAGIVAVIIVALLAVPFTRWPILNAIGFRSTLVITVQDESNRPVTLANVKLKDTVVISDKFGRAYFKNAPLGKQTLLIQKTGYGDKTAAVVNKFGTTKKTEQLKVIGIKLDIDIKDWLSGKVVEGAVAEYGKSTAASDATGRASLIIPPTDQKSVEILIKSPNYLPKTIKTETNVVSREVTLISSQKNYFISKRDGKFDIFSSNLDGSDQRKIIEATGKEDEALLQFSIHKNNKHAILVATRDGKVQSNRQVAGIYVVDLERASVRKIDEGSDVQLLDWGETAIAYRKSEPGLPYDDPNLSRLMSFNINSNKLSQVVSANYFQTELVAQNKIFYIPADAYRLIENSVLTSFDLGTSAKKTYLPDKLINNATRATYQALILQDVNGNMYEQPIGSGVAKAISRRSISPISAALSPNGQTAAWREARDGQGALIVRTIKDGAEKVAVRVGGLVSPVRFITDNIVVARVVTSQETADYAVDTQTGTIKKIVDVSNVGVNRQPGF